MFLNKTISSKVFCKVLHSISIMVLVHKVCKCMALQSLIDKTIGPEQSSSADEYLHGDDDLPVCVDLDGDDWETNS